MLWLIFWFIQSGTSQDSARAYVGQVTEITSEASFTAAFLRPNISREHSGFIYRWPDVEDVSMFCHSQIVGKLRPPEKYGRGLLKFDLNANDF